MRINFRDNEHAFTLTTDRVCHDFFRSTFAVHFGGVDQGHPKIDSQTQRRDFIVACAFFLAHAPRALTQRGYVCAVRQLHCLHTLQSNLETRKAEEIFYPQISSLRGFKKSRRGISRQGNLRKSV